MHYRGDDGVKTIGGTIRACYFLKQCIHAPLQHFNTSHTHPNESYWSLVRFAIGLFIRNVCTRISKVNVFPGKVYLLGRCLVARDKAAICVGIWTNPWMDYFVLAVVFLLARIVVLGRV